jgi:hypothetical protein
MDAALHPAPGQEQAHRGGVKAAADRTAAAAVRAAAEPAADHRTIWPHGPLTSDPEPVAVIVLGRVAALCI